MRLKKLLNLPSYLVRKFFYSYILPHDIDNLSNAVQEYFQEIRFLEEFITKANLKEFHHTQEKPFTDKEILLITKDIKAQYSVGELRKFRDFLYVLKILFSRYNSHFYGDFQDHRKVPAHLFIDKYLPLIDKLLVLVSSVEEEPQKGGKNRRKKANKGTDEGVHKPNSIREVQK